MSRRPPGRPPGHRRPVKERTAEALRAARGNLSAAAVLLGCSRQNVAETIDRYPELHRLSSEIIEESKDYWDQKLEELVMNKDNVAALLAKLNAYARDRGYNRTQTDVMVAGEIRHQHLYLTVGKYAHLSDAELAHQLEEARAKVRAVEAKAEPARLAPPPATATEGGETSP